VPTPNASNFFMALN